MTGSIIRENSWKFTR